MENSIILDDEAIEGFNPFALHKTFIKYAFISNIVNGLALLIPLFYFIAIAFGEISRDGFVFAICSPLVLYGYFLLVMYIRFKMNPEPSKLYRWVWFSSIAYNIAFVLCNVIFGVMMLMTNVQSFLQVFGIAMLLSLAHCIYMTIGSFKLFNAIRKEMGRVE